MSADLGHGSRKEGVLPLAPEFAAAIERDEHGESSPVRAPREYEIVDGERSSFRASRFLYLVGAHAQRLSAALDMQRGVAARA